MTPSSFSSKMSATIDMTMQHDIMATFEKNLDWSDYKINNLVKKIYMLLVCEKSSWSPPPSS